VRVFPIKRRAPVPRRASRVPSSTQSIREDYPQNLYHGCSENTLEPEEPPKPPLALLLALCGLLSLSAGVSPEGSVDPRERQVHKLPRLAIRRASLLP
jgi:hypothetical protein